MGGGQSPQSQQYAIAPDSQRFLVNVTAADASAFPITIVTNWITGLKK
jgi:hypothetical protein